MKIKQIIYNISILLLAVFFINCNSSDKIRTSDNRNRYIPVSKGNKWEYINEAPREETKTMTVEVTNTSKEGKDVIAELSSFPFFSDKDEKATLRIKYNGSVLYNNDTMLPASSKLVQGYTWNFGQWTGFVGSTSDTVKAENETFTDCIRIDYSISITFAADIWLAPGKGIVKWGYNRTNPPTFKPLFYVLNKLTLAK